MRWLGIALLALALILLPSTAVSAASSAGVMITATGYICEAPGGFTIIYVSDWELGLSWTKGTGANNTMIRGAIGRMPENRTDGYLVYYGDSNYATDWSVNLDTTDAKVHYRAWSQNAAGIWEEGETTDWIEGVGMKLIGIIVLCLGLMIPAFLWRKQGLMVAAGLAWMGLGFWNRTITPEWGTWDIYEILFYIGMAMTFLCFIESAILARKPSIEEIEAEATEAYVDEYGMMMENVRKLRRLAPRRR